LDEIAWKKVKGDVFRKPRHAMIFSIFIGTGIQIFAMTFCVLIFACVGLFSPTHRGGLVTALYLFLILLSNVSGYYTARFYKMFSGSEWLLCTIFVSFAYPSFVFIIFLITNFANWFERSSATVPFPTVLVLLFFYSYQYVDVNYCLERSLFLMCGWEL
jgi:transmembrane 9 superfamily protein 2/4